MEAVSVEDLTNNFCIGLNYLECQMVSGDDDDYDDDDDCDDDNDGDAKILYFCVPKYLTCILLGSGLAC